MRVLLETERLILRRFTEADADHLFDLDNDPEVMRYINQGVPTPREVIQEKILPQFLDYDESLPSFGFFAAIEKASHDFLGWFVFRSTTDDHRQVELGYRFRRVAWGKGFATEGARALIDKGFDELGVERVIATTYQDNLASRRVMEKVGMTLIRTFRMTTDDLANADTSYHGEAAELWEGDDVEYAIERSTWQRRQS